MENIIISSQNEPIIPNSVIQDMHLKTGDSLLFHKLGAGYYIEKLSESHFCEASEKDSLALSEISFAEEWLSEEDEQAFKNL